MLVMTAPALAQQPEVWLKPKHGNWSKDEITFSMTCQNVAAYIPDARFNPRDTYNPAASRFDVEGRNIGRDDELPDAELPGDHPGRAWGHTMWSHLCSDCYVEPKYELTINLAATISSNSTPPVDLDDLHLGGLVNRRGPSIEVTRVWNTRNDDKNVPISAFCPSGSSETFEVTVTAMIKRGIIPKVCKIIQSLI